MPKIDWQIREAEPKDSASLQLCMEMAYASYTDRMGGKRLPPMDVDYSSEIRDFPTWVAEYKETIIGGLTLLFEKNYTSLANIAVHPEFQGHGIGSGLLNFAERQAKNKNYSELRLATHVLLTENVSLYLHLGWTEIDRDEVRVYMNKAI